MNKLLSSVGHFLIVIGFIGGGIVWIATTVYFFSNDETFLGLLSFFVPPSAAILPWVVSTTLGIASIGSAVSLLIGGLLLSKSE
jgi:hypothetical protein